MRVTRRIEIARPPEAVWPVLEDPDEMKRWMPGLVDVLPGEGLDPESGLGPGTAFIMKMKEPRDKVAHYDGEVLAYEPPRRLRLKMWGGSFKENEVMFGEFLLEERTVDGRAGTKLTYDVQKDLEGWLLNTLKPLIWVLGHLHLARVMRKIRRRVEERDRPAGERVEAGAAS